MRGGDDELVAAVRSAAPESVVADVEFRSEAVEGSEGVVRETLRACESAEVVPDTCEAIVFELSGR